MKTFAALVLWIICVKSTNIIKVFSLEVLSFMIATLMIGMCQFCQQNYSNNRKAKTKSKMLSGITGVKFEQNMLN